jgi:hypothetical protein
MQQKDHNKLSRNRGRPKKSPLTPREQARIRKTRQRAKFARNDLSKVEIFLPSALKTAIKKAAGIKSFSEISQEALQIWLESRSK